MTLGTAWGRDWGPPLEVERIHTGVYEAMRQGWVLRPRPDAPLMLTAAGIAASRVLAMQLGCFVEIFGITPPNYAAAMSLICVRRPDWRP